MNQSAVAHPTEGNQEKLVNGTSIRQRSLWMDAFARLLRNRLALVGLVMTTALFLIAIFAPALAPYAYTEQNLMEVAQPPSATHWLGTDEIGRDIFSRILYGARTATLVAIFSTTFSVLLGTMFGLIAGYGGRWADAAVGRLIDTEMAIPSLLLAALIAVSVRDPVVGWVQSLHDATGWGFLEDTSWLDLLIVFGGLSFVQWPVYARLIRGQILSLREEQYVVAAQSIGVSTAQIAWRHLLPNALGPVIVVMTFNFSSAMVAESSLSYLGIGVRPPQASWGNMIASNIPSWSYRPWLVAVPAITLALATLGINFLGDGLNDALNPKSGKSI